METKSQEMDSKDAPVVLVEETMEEEILDMAACLVQCGCNIKR